ncbi:cytochrome P450 family protein [Xylaria palmicola]|nr:cytochrome P450 family protein [Xylaria palmicola]
MVDLSGSLSIIGLIGLLLYSTVVRFIQWRRLSHIPGPLGVGWSKLWLLRHVASGKLPKKLEEISGDYGPLVRIGPKWVVCSDPTEIRRMWAIRSGFHRGSWYSSIRLSAEEENIFTLLGNKEHHHLRARLLPGYVGRGFSDDEKKVDAQIEKLIRLIERNYISSSSALRPCDLARTMQFLTQDVITAVGFGQSAGYLDVDEDIYGIIEATQTLLLPAHIVTVLPFIGKILASPLMRPFLPKATDKQGVGRFLAVVKGHVDKRYGSEKIRRDDMLQTFVDSDLRRTQVESEALVTLFGGTDTTATAIRNAIFFLSTNPSVYHKLQIEIDASAKSVDRPVISDQQAKGLPYLQACIKESLRLWPPSMGMMGKVSDRDEMLCGIKVPAQTQIGWAPLAIMKDPHVFGENAGIFEPARWLEAEPEKLKEMDWVYGLVFATGTRWECLGKKLAYIELGKVLFELLHRFDFAMVNPMEPFKWANHGFTTQQNMNAKITQRKVSTDESLL